MDKFLMLFILASSSFYQQPGYGSVLPSSTTEAEKINITVALEMYCPDSMRFANNQLWPTYQQLKDYMSVEILAHGKPASGEPDQEFDENTNRWRFTCQHGPPECRGNLINTCAIHLAQRDEEKSLSFVKCFFEGDPTDWFNSGGHSHRRPMRTGRKCATEIGIAWNKMRECINGIEGNQLQHEVATRTPELGYVPWIYVNGRDGSNLNQRAETDLKGLLCEEIPEPKPDVCREEVPELVQLDTEMDQEMD